MTRWRFREHQALGQPLGFFHQGHDKSSSGWPESAESGLQNQ
jgi:hypothetical protein